MHSPLHPADQHEPVVLLGLDADSVASSGGGSGSAAVTPVSAVTAVAVSALSQAILTSLGLTDPLTWADFRLDQIPTDRIGKLFSKHAFIGQGVGISIPLFDPRTPDEIIGVVRLCRAQAKHACTLTGAHGLGGARDLDRHQRIVLADGPLLAMRLHQAGVQGVALVEEPEMLRPLLDWVRTKEVVLASAKQPRIAAMRAVLGEQGQAAAAALIPFILAGASAQSLTALGLIREQVRPDVRAPLSPQDLRLLVAYAIRQRESNVHHAELAALGITPEFADAFQIGVLPRDFRNALPSDLRQRLGRYHLSGHLLVPALDEHDAVVDAVMVDLASGFHGEQPLGAGSGLIGSRMVRVHQRLVVVDDLRRAAQQWVAGERGIVLLRDGAEAARQAARLVAAGVTAVEVDTVRRPQAIIAALGAVGLHLSVMGADQRGSVVAVQAATERVADQTEARAVVPASESLLAPVPVPGVVVASESGLPILVTTRESVVAAPLPLVEVAPAPAVAHDPPRAEPSRSTPRSVSVTVGEDPQRPGALTLSAIALTERVATFHWTDLVFAVKVPPSGASLVELVVRRGSTAVPAELDLALAVQVQRTVAQLVPVFGGDAVEWTSVLSDLRVLLGAIDWSTGTTRAVLPGASRPIAIAPSGAASRAPVPAPTLRTAAEVRAAAATSDPVVVGLLLAPDLLDQLCADLDDLGWLGDQAAKRVVLLVLASLGTGQPLSVILRGSPLLTGPALTAIRAILPDDRVRLLHRATASRLLAVATSAPAGETLVAPDLGSLTSQSQALLRSLLTAGSHPLCTLTATTATAVQVIGASPTVTDVDLCAQVVPLDSSPSALAIIGHQLMARSVRGVDTTRVQAALARLRGVLFPVARTPVLVPYAEQIDLPLTALHHLAFLRFLLAAIAAHAALHRQQRPHQGGLVLATEADFTPVASLLAPLLGTVVDGLSAAAEAIRRTLAQQVSSGAATPEAVSAGVGAGASGAITAVQAETSLPALTNLLPSYPRTTLREALDELIGLGLADGDAGGRGRRVRTYRVTLGATAANAVAALIVLRPPMPTASSVSTDMTTNAAISTVNIPLVGTGACAVVAELSEQTHGVVPPAADGSGRSNRRSNRQHTHPPDPPDSLLAQVG